MVQGGKQRDGRPADVVFKRVPVIVGGTADRPRTSAAVMFARFVAGDDEAVADTGLLVQMAVAMALGQFYNYRQLTEALGMSGGGKLQPSYRDAGGGRAVHRQPARHASTGGPVVFQQGQEIV